MLVKKLVHFFCAGKTYWVKKVLDFKVWISDFITLLQEYDRNVMNMSLGKFVNLFIDTFVTTILYYDDECMDKGKAQCMNFSSQCRLRTCGETLY